MIFTNKKFISPIKTITAFCSSELKKAFDDIEEYKKSYFLLGYVRYEAKDAFDHKQIISKHPLLYFQVFENFETFHPHPFPKHANLVPIQQISFATYQRNIQKIKTLLFLGETYQVNYAHHYTLTTTTTAFDLYQQLLKRQTTPYNAFIENDYEQILSFSPELFFEIENNIIKTKPMKGTIERGNTNEEDLKNIHLLQNDLKNRAENLMIVDLLRNDLGKIAKPHSIKVQQLFDIETHQTLHQMTSDIQAELKDNCSLYDIFKALFPCGSVTGAPKINTMNIISMIEKTPRDVYCGAIGLITPTKTTFSVPIRILQKKKHAPYYRCHVGSGIVWDSNPTTEWEETITKTKFLAERFDLIETIKVEEKSFFLLDLHLKRLQSSAKYFGFKFNPNILTIKPQQNGILRIILSSNGDFKEEYLPLKVPTTSIATVAQKRISSDNEFLYHKTTFRPWYQDTMEKIRKGDVYDEIFLNENNEITEGSRCNVLFEINGELFTPPVECGLLNGIYRQYLLTTKQCKERKLYLHELKNVQNVYLINSVRGIKKVSLLLNK